MFIYQIIIKPKQFVYVSAMLHLITTANWFWVTKKPTQDAESSAPTISTEPYAEQALHRTSTPPSEPLQGIIESSSSVSSLEFDKPDFRKKKVSVINKKKSRGELTMWIQKAGWRTSSSPLRRSTMAQNRYSGLRLASQHRSPKGT
ncbi:hypothetical protein FGIG_08328 [Fasciola gigantica]|uniref:Uncharacterized protein n=1 Tax=Fasciola gigantica TaxID=46835 RepID=A0A504YMW0_FASGI|nr:hypothetical protein FGIG_08328 [Fasciola gigantica]